MCNCVMGKYIRKYDGGGHIVDKGRNQPWYGKSVYVHKFPDNEYDIFYVSPDYPEAGWHFDETTRYSMRVEDDGDILLIRVEFDAIDDYLIDNDFYVAVEFNLGRARTSKNKARDKGIIITNLVSIKDFEIGKGHYFPVKRSPEYKRHWYENALSLYGNMRGINIDLPDDWVFYMQYRICFLRKSSFVNEIMNGSSHPIIRDYRLVMKNFIRDFIEYKIQYKDL